MIFNKHQISTLAVPSSTVLIGALAIRKRIRQLEAKKMRIAELGERRR